MRVFISHSSSNAALAEEICGNLEKNGYDCFIAPRNIRSGHEYAEELINGIDNCELMVLILSEQSNGSPHVLREVERAVSKNKPIIVYKLDNVTLSKSMEYFLMTHQWLESKPGKEPSEISEAVKRFFTERNTAQTETVSEEKKAENIGGDQSGKKSKMKFLPVIAAVPVLAAGAIAVSISMNKQELPAIAPESSQSIAEAAEAAVHTTPETESATTDTHSADESTPSTPEQPAETVAQTTQITTTTQTVETTPSAQATQTTSAIEISETSAPEPTETVLPAVEIEEGSSLFLGTYNGKPIEWRVIHISDDNKSAVVVSDKILTMKAFDAAEGGSFNKSDSESYWRTPNDELSEDVQRAVRGDNRWEYSNIRTWLNSTKEMVQYSDTAPAASAMSEHKNGYNTESGFLRGFTKAELSVILPTDIVTNGAVTEDMVFLLASDELEWLYGADVSVFAKPTAEAVEQDTSGWYSMYLDTIGSTEFLWWLRDADSTNACKSHIVNISSMDDVTSTQYVGLEGYGIRPAMTVDLTSPELRAIVQGLE